MDRQARFPVGEIGTNDPVTAENTALEDRQGYTGLRKIFYHIVGYAYSPRLNIAGVGKVVAR